LCTDLGGLGLLENAEQTAEWTHSADSPEVKVCFDLMPKLPLRTLSKYMNTTGDYNAVVVWMI